MWFVIAFVEINLAPGSLEMSGDKALVWQFTSHELARKVYDKALTNLSYKNVAIIEALSVVSCH